MAPVFPAWSVSAEEALQHHGVQLASGLSSSEVEARRSKYGFNELEKAPGTPLWKLILEQFDDTLVKVMQGIFRPRPCLRGRGSLPNRLLRCRGSHGPG